MWNKIKEYLYIQEFGWYELLFVLLPTVSSYKYGSVPMMFVWLILIDMIALHKYSFHIEPRFKYYKWLYIYVFIHNLVWLFVIPSVSSVFINTWIGQILILTSLFIITPALDFKKLRGPLNIISIVFVGGLLYHVMLVMSGQIVFQIPLPFLPEPDHSRLLEEGIRPKSFFPEPQAYCTYMLIPLYLFLMGKRYIMAGLIIVSMMLSTSTTGLFTGFLMLGFYAFTQKIGMKWKFVMVLAGVGLILMLNRSELFDATLSKVISENNGKERTEAGMIVAEQLDISDFVFGIPYASVGEMADAGMLNTSEMMDIGDGQHSTFFIPAFWNIMFIYGIFGLFIYLLVYYDIFKKNRLIWPFLSVIVITLFSNPDGIGVTYIYQLAFMYCFIDYYNEYQTIE